MEIYYINKECEKAIKESKRHKWIPVESGLVERPSKPFPFSMFDIIDDIHEYAGKPEKGRLSMTYIDDYIKSIGEKTTKEQINKTLKKGRKVKKSKSKQWEERLLKRFKNVSAIKFDYKTRTTTVWLKSGFVDSTTLLKGEKWDFEKGFYVAYSKILEISLKKIADNIRFFI